MTVELGGDAALEHRQDVLDERRPARHPLVVAAAAVPVGPVQARARKALDQPAKQRLVADVHAQGDLRLLAVAPERPLADQDADETAPVECA